MFREFSKRRSDSGSVYSEPPAECLDRSPAFLFYPGFPNALIAMNRRFVLSETVS